MLAESVADKIISLYALGTSIRDNSTWKEENLGNRISAVTDRFKFL